MAGRPKGQLKTGGRTAGTPNKVNATTRERIEEEADPIGFLINVVNGAPIEVAAPGNSKKTITVHPTYEQRQDAAKTLARKVMPDMRAVEHSGNVDPRDVSELSTDELLAIIHEGDGRDGTAGKANGSGV